MRKYLPLFIFLTFIVLSKSAEKIKCKQCESNKDAKCAQNPDLIEAKDCGDEDDRCIVEIDNKNTVRKCGKKDYCKGSGKDTDTCKECPTAEDCGKVFPENRPQCIQCTGKDCADDSKVPSSLPCINYDKDEKCYALVTDNKDGYRGCMSDTTSDVCTKSENDKFCKRCASSEKDCNKKYKDIVECFKCSGNDCKRPKSIEDNCKINAATEKCDVLYGRKACYILKKENEVTRGCWGSLTQPITGYLQECDGEKCNDECFKDLECQKCKSSDNPDCAKDTIPKAKCDEYTSACHWCEDKDGNAHRGCGKGDEGLRCNYAYKEEDEPKKPQISCYECKKDDPNCATLEKALTSKECPKVDDECVVLLQDDKTIRGCLSEIFTDKTKECKEEEYCKRCNSNNCNGDIYPADRRKCYQCSKTADCKDSPEDKIKPMPCAIFSPTDKCYTYTEGSDIFRGCWSDPTKNCKDSDKKCVTCDSSNCNKEPPTKAAKLKCMKCDKDKPECSWAQGKDSEVPCTGNVEYWQKETCFTYLHNATLVSRGCTLGSDKCDNGDKCQKCEGEYCNKKNMIPFKCYRCRSDDVGDEKCAETAEGIEPRQCDNNDNIGFNDRGCYTRRDGGVIIRGCLVDLKTEVRATCKEKDSKECLLCLEANCNNNKPPNSSTANKLSFVLLCFATIIISFK